jgi:hypothetical protein
MKPDEELAHHVEEKAETLRQFFFPPLLRAVLSDFTLWLLNAQRSRRKRLRM